MERFEEGLCKCFGGKVGGVEIGEVGDGILLQAVQVAQGLRQEEMGVGGQVGHAQSWGWGWTARWEGGECEGGVGVECGAAGVAVAAAAQVQVGRAAQCSFTK